MNYLNVIVFSFLFMALVFLQPGCQSCQDEGCKTNGDCPSGKICQNGKCVDDEDPGTGDGDSDGDGDGDGDGDTDGDMDADTDADTDSDSGPEDTGTECDGSLRNGSSCVADCQCASGHCESDICCSAEECCQEVSDCESNLCQARSCDANSNCNYSIGGFTCGAEDDVGSETCTGDNRCDGEGHCVPFVPCENGYRSDGTFDCSDGNAVEVCLTGCETVADCDQDAGYNDCVEGECVYTGLDDGAACTDPEECISGHCQNGFCCLDGDCCAADGDCPEGLCGEAYCDVNSMCDIDGDTYVPIGREDLTEPNTCTDTSRCNGRGECLEVTVTCDGAYAADGTYSLVDGALAEDCFTSCGNQMQCNDGYICDNTECKASDLSPDGVSCSSDDECLSGNCDADICCPAGASCCQAESDCDDGDPCTTEACSADHRCFAIPMLEGEPCGDDKDFCNGEETCDADGQCVAGPPPCESDTICVIKTCNEETDSCEVEINVDAIDQPCSEALWCYNDRELVCDADGRCVDPDPSAGVRCETADVCNPVTCDEESQRCVTTQLEDGSNCDDGDPCTGTNTCQNGECVVGEFLPCDDHDPCTQDLCSAQGDSVDCVNEPIADDEPCEDKYNCFGSAPVCYQGQCIASEDVCPGDLGMCTRQECQEVYYDDFSCGPTLYLSGTAVECDTTTTIYGDEALPTRSNDTYSGDCSGSYPGPEGSILVTTPIEGPVTVEITGVTPAMNVHLIKMTSICDVTTCLEETAGGSITFDAAIGANSVVIDTEEILPPESIDITVTCPE